MKFLSNILAKAGLIVDGQVTLNSVANATSNTDKFIVVDTGVVKYRSAAQLLSDIGAQATLTNPVTGTGTTNTLPKFSGASTLTDSIIREVSGSRLLVGSGTVDDTTSTIQTNGQIKAVHLTLDGAVSNNTNLWIKSVTGYLGQIIYMNNSNMTFALRDNATYWDIYSYVTGNTGQKFIVYATGTVKLPGYTTNGFLKTSASDGTLIVDTNTYLTGNQSISLSGDATGSGTTSIAVTLANSGVTAGTYGSASAVPVVTVDAKGRVTGVTTASISGSLTFTGDVTGSGTTGSSTTLTLANSGVTAGTYQAVTVDAKGRVTSGSNPTTVSGFGITDAYTKSEVDAFLQGLDPKASVKVATTANITLSGTQTIDGIAVSAGDRVLVKDQSTASQNGIYVVAAGAWTRATDMDVAAEFPGAYVFVEQGTANADKGYVCTNDSVTVGTTSVTFAQFSGSGAYQSVLNGTGYVKMAGTSLSYISSIPIADLAASSITIQGTTVSLGGSVNVINGTGFVKASGTTITYDNSTYLTAEADTLATVTARGATTTAAITVDQVIANNNGNGTNYRVGDDLWIGDVNLANTTRFMGVQNNANAYIIFGNGDTTALGRAGTGALTYGGNTVYHSGNLTNLNQLTNGPGYITSYTETDTLSTVTGRGASTSTAITLNTGGNVVSTSTWEKWKLITTGVTAPARQGSDANGLNFTSNALWNAGWSQDDSTKKSFAYIQHLGNGRHEFRTSASGGTISWIVGLTIDEAGAAFNVPVTISGNTVYHAGNLTNLNQLTNGPGYITSASLSSYLPLTGGTLTGNLTIQSSSNPTQFLLRGTNTELYLDANYGAGTARLFINRQGTGNQATLHFTTGMTVTPGTAWASTGAPMWNMGMTNSSQTSDFKIGYGDIYSAGDVAVRIDTSKIVYFTNTPYVGSNIMATQSWVQTQGYITSYTETDTLATVTGRGANTSSFVSMTGGSKIVVQNSTDGGSSRGLFLWNSGDTNWGIYMAQAGVGKSLSDGTAPASIDGRTEHHIRYRVNSSVSQGHLWENNIGLTLMSLTGDTGNLYTRGNIYAGNSTSNLVLHAGNYNSYAPTLTGTGASGTWGISITGTATSVVNNTDGAVIMESNASENNNWLWKENAKAWGLFWFNRGSQSGQTIGTYTTVGAETMYMGGNTGIGMPSGWTGYYSGSNIAAMISNYNGYIYSHGTIFANGRFETRDGLYFERGDGSFTTFIRSNNHPDQGYTGSNQKYWVELGSYGGVHVTLNMDGAADSGENGFDHFTIWQAAANSTSGSRQFYVTNIGNVWARGGITANTSFYVTDSNTTLNRGNGYSFRHTGPYGWTEIGAQNSSWSHFQTDRPNFYFNKSVYIDGQAWIYGGSRLVENNGGTWSINITGSAGSLSSNSDYFVARSGGTGTSIDTYTDNGWRTLSYTGYSSQLWSVNSGGSTGTVQFELEYNTPVRGFKVRNKTDNNSWSAIGYVVMTTTNQGHISGTIWHSGNLTNLNQLTNGPGYITSYTETDTLATVTNRGNTTTGRINVRGAGNQAGGNILMGNTGNATSKWSYLTGAHYNQDTQTQGVSIIGLYSDNAANTVVIGGSIYEANPATEIQFWTHTATTHNLGGSKRMIIDTNGNVGINVNSATQKLEVNGNIKLTNGGYIYGDGSNADLGLSNNGGSILRYGSVYIKALAASIKLIATSEEISLQNNNGSIWMTAGGNVAINHTTPQKKLDVVGTGIAASFGGLIGAGSIAGFAFGYSESSLNNDLYKKSALVFERTDNHGQGGNASGKIHFLLNNIGNASATSLTSAVVTIDSAANGANGSVRMGVGNTSPVYTLDVSGTIRGTTSIISPQMYGTSYSTLTSGAGTGTAVFDTLTTSGAGAYEVVIVANPNGGGSGSYADWYIGKLLIGTGYNNTSVVHYIDFIQQSPMPRTLFGSGGGDLTVTAVFNNSGTESEEAANGSTYVIRFKISGYNTSYTGTGTTIYLKKIGT